VTENFRCPDLQPLAGAVPSLGCLIAVQPMGGDRPAPKRNPACFERRLV